MRAGFMGTMLGQKLNHRNGLTKQVPKEIITLSIQYQIDAHCFFFSISVQSCLFNGIKQATVGTIKISCKGCTKNVTKRDKNCALAHKVYRSVSFTTKIK